MNVSVYNISCLCRQKQRRNWGSFGYVQCLYVYSCLHRSYLCCQWLVQVRSQSSNCIHPSTRLRNTRQSRNMHLYI